MLVFCIFQIDWAQESVYLFSHFGTDRAESGKPLVYIFERGLLDNAACVSKLLPNERSKVM
jgi:hypothetical protein